MSVCHRLPPASCIHSSSSPHASRSAPTSRAFDSPIWSAEAFFPMPTFAKKKDPKKQAAGSAGASSRWRSTADTAPAAVEAEAVSAERDDEMIDAPRTPPAPSVLPAFATRTCRAHLTCHGSRAARCGHVPGTCGAPLLTVLRHRGDGGSGSRIRLHRSRSSI